MSPQLEVGGNGGAHFWDGKNGQGLSRDPLRHGKSKTAGRPAGGREVSRTVDTQAWGAGVTAELGRDSTRWAEP